MSIVLWIKTWIVRLLLYLNERMEHRQHPKVPKPVHVEKITSPSPRGFVDLHFYIPADFRFESSKQHPLVVNFHGGGFCSGSPGMDARFIGSLLKSSTQPVVVSVGYSLAPEHPFPAAVQDSAAAITWLATEGARKYNLDPRRIVTVGFSAGGILALAAPMWIERYGQEDPQQAKLTYPLAGAVSMYCGVDARTPRQPSKSALLNFLYSVWDEAYYSQVPANSPFVSLAAADDALLRKGLPAELGLYPVAHDPHAQPTEKFRQRLLALGKHVTGHVEPDAAHAWDKSPAKDDLQWRKREEWHGGIIRAIEKMLRE